MRLVFKILSVLGLFLILYALSPPSAYALSCSGTGYTCRQLDCAMGEVEDTTRTCTNYNYICCKKVPTSTPQPQPTNPPPTAGAQPTATPQPTIGGANCSNPPAGCSKSDYCMVINCGKTIANCPAPPIPTVSNCSSVCLNNSCYTTNLSPHPTITNQSCTTWGSWGACLSGQGTCAACAAQGYTCQTRFCANPPSSNQYQISCRAS